MGFDLLRHSTLARPSTSDLASPLTFRLANRAIRLFTAILRAPVRPSSRIPDISHFADCQGSIGNDGR